jgi:hypothetical protein
MDPISVAIEIELATLILAGVGAFATWVHHKHSERAHRQRELHHQQIQALLERQHQAQLRLEDDVLQAEKE